MNKKIKKLNKSLKEHKEKKDKIFSNIEIGLIKDFDSITNEKMNDSELLDSLKELKKSCYENNINLGRLLLKCFDYLDINSNSLKDEEEDYSNKLKEYLKKFNVSELRLVLQDYGNGEEFGSYLIGERLKRMINENRDSYLELIKLFFDIFGEE